MLKKLSVRARTSAVEAPIVVRVVHSMYCVPVGQEYCCLLVAQFEGS